MTRQEDSFLLNHILERLSTWADQSPDKTAYAFLADDTSINYSISYSELWQRIRSHGSALMHRKMTGQRILLIYPDSLQFITAFYSCLYCGAIPVPMFFPNSKKRISRLKAAVEDAKAAMVLCEEGQLDRLKSAFQDWNLPLPPDFCSLEELIPAGESDMIVRVPSEISFIQYTSGSTGTPKGVVISSVNLMENLKMIKDAFNCTRDSVIFSWLPFYHDMGLIGNIIEGVFVGCSTYLMSPFQFMRKPAIWMHAITKYKVTHSGGPNFSFDLCTDKIEETEMNQIDLSSWRVAYNGSEPVKSRTMDRFEQVFGKYGFQANSFYPCYGLAEATLLVTAKPDRKKARTISLDRQRFTQNSLMVASNNSVTVVSSGRPINDVCVAVCKDGVELNEFELGEIYLSGRSVSAGYWGRPSDYVEVKSSDGNKRMFPTGDIGFVLDGEVFITGRNKELLIVRGKNYFPHDIEAVVSCSHPSLIMGGVAAISFETASGEEALCVVAELKRECLASRNYGAIKQSLQAALAAEVGLLPEMICFVKPMSLPRTSSGKVQRVALRQQIQAGELIALDDSDTTKVLSPASQKLEQNLIAEVIRLKSEASISEYIKLQIMMKMGNETCPIETSMDLFELGLDSLKAMELINKVNRDLDISLEPYLIFKDASFKSLVYYVESVLYLKKKENLDADCEIVI